MFRYRCPECQQVLQAPELRAGKASVCPKCSKKITIPADRGQWIRDESAPEPPAATTPASVPDFSFPVDDLAPIPVSLHEPTPPPEPDPIPAEPPLVAAEHEETEPPVVIPAPAALTLEPPVIVPAPAAVSPEPPAPPEPESLPQPTPVIERPASQRYSGTVSVAAARRVEDMSERVDFSTPTESLRPLPQSLRTSGRVSAASAIRPTPVEPVAEPEPVPTETRLPHATTTITPPPSPNDAGRARPRQVVAVPARAPGREAYAASDDAVSFNEPLHLRSDMEIAAALTDVLTTRMKPPPKPPRDLYPSTAFWLLLTGIALGLLGMTLFRTLDYLKWVAYIGVAQIAIGYVWIVVLTFRREPTAALACAVPPVTLWYLTRKRYRRYRPLRFVGTGAILLLCAGLAPHVLSETRQWAGADDNMLPELPTEITNRPEVEQLREYREKRQYDRLLALLRKLDRTDPLFSSSAPDRERLTAELKILTDKDHTKDSTIRAAALPAYVRWSGDNARDVLLAAIQGLPDERRQAIKLLPRWRDADVARVLASRLAHREETALAKNALIELGGPLAAQSLIPLLRDKEKDKILHLAVLDLLSHPRLADEQVLAFLRSEKEKFSDPSLNRQVELKILEIQNLLQERKASR